MRRDRVIVPTYTRPELLCLCLERLFACPEIQNLDVHVYVDHHTDQPPPPLAQIENIVAKFSYPHLFLNQCQPHSYEGNSYNVLTAYAEAYEAGCERIFEVEDDILVEPDFFTWQYRQFARGNDWFAVIGAKNFRTKPPVDAADAYKTLGEDLVSWGVGYPRETIRKVLPHIRREYFSDLHGYCKKAFPRFHGAGSEQDGLLQRIMVDDPKPVAWSVPIRAWHVGYYGYHRTTVERPQGTLDERVAQVRKIIADPKRLREISCADDVEIDYISRNVANDWLWFVYGA